MKMPKLSQKVSSVFSCTFYYFCLLSLSPCSASKLDQKEEKVMNALILQSWNI